MDALRAIPGRIIPRPWARLLGPHPIFGGSIMKRASLLLAVAGFLISPLAHAQQYVAPNYNNCVQLVDGGFGTIAIKNICNISISVTTIPFNGGSGGQLDISPGSSQGTGSTWKEKADAGGWDFYVCPRNYSPVNGNDRGVSKPNTQFHCKKEF
jgi:hypothetical protein